MYGIEELIALAAEKRASDVHLIAGLPPKCRIDGRIETLTDGGLTREDCEEYGRQLAGNAADQIEAIGQLDFSASFAGRRLRVNLFRQQGALSAAIRLLGSTIPNLSELGLPEAVNQFSSWNKGIILVTAEKVRIVQDADAIYREEIAKAGIDRTLGQYFAALTNMRSVGCMGDVRTYDYAIALRAVLTSDFMTAESAELPWEVLGKVTSRIVNEVKGVNRVLYDCTGKPPATIEFE